MICNWIKYEHQSVLFVRIPADPQKSKFDLEVVKIKELLALGLSVRKIAIFLGYTNHIGLNTYINKRNLRETAITNGAEQDRGV